MTTIEFIAPPIHKFADAADYPQWSKTLYLALEIMGFERFILDNIVYKDDATPELISKRNMVMLMMESSISSEIKRTLVRSGYDNLTLDPKLLFDWAYQVFYMTEEDDRCRYTPPGYFRGSIFALEV